MWVCLMGVQGTTLMISAAIDHSPLIYESGRRGEAKFKSQKSKGLKLGLVLRLKSACFCCPWHFSITLKGVKLEIGLLTLRIVWEELLKLIKKNILINTEQKGIDGN